MINKKNMWFLTLFSLILVLSVYYITMPKELLLTGLNDIGETKEVDTTIEDISALEVMKMENEIVAPEDGTIKEILVKETDKVAAGQKLIVLA